jgi:hypothetical protein
MTLLNKGFEYNLNFKPKTRISKLTLRAQTTISMLDVEQKHSVRELVAKEIWQLIDSNETTDKKPTLLDKICKY